MDETSDEAQVQQSEHKAALDQSERIVTQPTANGILPHHDTAQAPPPHSDRSESSVTDSLSSNDDARLLPGPAPCSSQPQTETNRSRCSSCNRISCTLHHHHHHHRQTGANQRQPSSKSSASIRTDAAHIKQASGGDCCVHCLLACLFCELPSLCSALGQCLFCCGVGGACAEGGGACCCCPDALIGCGCCLEAGCSEETFGALSDCGIVETCCGSSDCLEICLECCSICYPS